MSPYTIVFEEMKIRAKLLETVVQRIIDRILEEHKTVEEVTIEVQKLNPPIGGNVGYVSVERKGKRLLLKKIKRIFALWHRGRVARQSSAKACTAVRIRSVPQKPVF